MLTTRPRRWSGTISCTSEAVIEKTQISEPPAKKRIRLLNQNTRE